MNVAFARLKAAPSPNGQPTTTPADAGNPARRADAPQAPSPYADRDAKGCFAPGNPGGPGNPYARQSALLKRIFLEEGAPERIRRIARKLLDLAEVGNVQAAKIVLNYCLGKPIPGVNPDRVDLDELEGFKEASDRSKDRIDYWLPELELTLDGLRMAREQCTERTRKMTIAAMMMPVERAQRINKLPEKEREAELLAAYERFARKKEKEAARETARREREAAREASRLAREAAGTSPDPFCNAAQINVAGGAGPIPNGKT